MASEGDLKVEKPMEDVFVSSRFPAVCNHCVISCQTTDCESVFLAAMALEDMGSLILNTSCFVFTEMATHYAFPVSLYWLVEAITCCNKEVQLSQNINPHRLRVALQQY